MKRSLYYLSLALLPASITYAGSMGDKVVEHSPQRYFIAIGSGISFANNANPAIVNYLWSDALEVIVHH